MNPTRATPHLDLSVRGEQAELALSGSGSADDVSAIVEEAHRLTATIAEPVTFHLAADHPAEGLGPVAESVADGLGFTERRDLLHLRRPLPVPANHPARRTAPLLATRPIRLGGDEPNPGGDDVEAWLRANNRAFAHHADQGRENVDTLRERLDVEWTDPSGFLVADDADRPGELAGFCWTKIHPATGDDPTLGEIYVISVDPSHRGEGLGPTLVLAGLDHLASRGLETAMLYVDADNDPARRLYDSLGFVTHHRRRVYTAPKS